MIVLFLTLVAHISLLAMLTVGYGMVWLFPALFLIHDLEEIVGLKSWIERNGKVVGERFPRFAPMFRGYTTERMVKAVARRLTEQVANRCESSFLDDCMVVGTSAMIETELDCIINQYTDKFCNPMVMWGKYRKGWIKTKLPISFQFHHVQMDGGHAATFLNSLQDTINCIL